MTNTPLTHIDSNGNAIMVDVSNKDITERIATASGWIYMQPETFQRITKGAMKKGDVLTVAQLAGIMGTKKTSDLIPMCHPLFLEKCTVTFELFPEKNAIQALCTTKVSGKTGVEMEALTGVSTALLTIYDMCKAIDRGMILTDIQLLEKKGGKSGHYIRKEGN